MPRTARLVIPDMAHHVTQRGNRSVRRCADGLKFSRESLIMHVPIFLQKSNKEMLKGRSWLETAILLFMVGVAIVHIATWLIIPVNRLPLAAPTGFTKVLYICFFLGLVCSYISVTARFAKTTRSKRMLYVVLCVISEGPLYLFSLINYGTVIAVNVVLLMVTIYLYLYPDGGKSHEHPGTQ